MEGVTIAERPGVALSSQGTTTASHNATVEATDPRQRRSRAKSPIAECSAITGCMSDGETIQAAIANGREALRDCLEVFRESGRKPAKPNIKSAQWRQRLPRTLYARLTRQAQREGVSINCLVTAIIAEAVGSRQGSSQKVG